MNVSELILSKFEELGSKYVFGLPGEENIEFLQELSESNLKLVLTRHEQAAGFMAAAYSRLTSKPGVCFSTLAPGAMNFATAIAYSKFLRTNTVFITAQQSRKEYSENTFQSLDAGLIFQNLVKNTFRIDDIKTAPARLKEAFLEIEFGEPGPVHIILSEDMAVTELGDVKIEHPELNYLKSNLDPERIDAIQRIISSANHPLIMFGADVKNMINKKLLLDFVNQTSIPFFTTQMAKGAIDENNEFYLGTTAVSSGDYIHCAIAKADLIISIGHDNAEKKAFEFEDSTAPVLDLNFQAQRINNNLACALELHSLTENQFKTIIESLKPDEFSFDLSSFYETKALMDQNIYNEHCDSCFPVKPQDLIRKFMKVFDENTIFNLDNGMYKLWFTRHFKVSKTNNVFLDNSLATMGAGLPAAICSALVHPEKTNIALCGDGGFAMNMQELETATRLGVNLIIIIVVDDGYGMIKWKQKKDKCDEFGLNYTPTDYESLAKAFNQNYLKVNDFDSLENILKDAKSKEGVTLVEVPIDYSENTDVFIEEIEKDLCH